MRIIAALERVRGNTPANLQTALQQAQRVAQRVQERKDGQGGGGQVKAFTVYQPYAYAIVAGLKGYETRPRRTHIRGRVAVHAGKGKSQFVSMPVSIALPESAVLHYGAVLGTVEIVDCVPVEALIGKLSERERVLGDYTPGRFAWVLKNPVMFDRPIPARGFQGWWNWEERSEDER